MSRKRSHNIGHAALLLAISEAWGFIFLFVGYDLDRRDASLIGESCPSVNNDIRTLMRMPYLWDYILEMRCVNRTS